MGTPEEGAVISEVATRATWRWRVGLVVLGFFAGLLRQGDGDEEAASTELVTWSNPFQVTRGATLTTLYESLDANKTSLDFKTRRKFLCFPGPGSTTPLDVDGVMHYHTVENLQFFLNYNEGCQTDLQT